MEAKLSKDTLVNVFMRQTWIPARVVKYVFYSTTIGEPVYLVEMNKTKRTYNLRRSRIKVVQTLELDWE
jgi:hypothetical protein